jgi:uncharacterized YceG family protein
LADDLDWRAIIAPGNDADPGTRASARSEDPGARRRRRGEAAEPAPGPRRRGGAAPTPDPGADADVPTDARPAPATPAPAPADAPLSRREARQRSAAEPASDAGRDAGRVQATPADAPVAERLDQLHPEVHALLAPGAGAPTDGTGGGTGDGGAGNGGGGRRGGRGGASRPPREPRRKRSRGALVAGIVIVAVVLAAGAGGYVFLQPKIAAVVSKISGKSEPTDYTGSGTGKVVVTINEGDIGSDVAKTLQDRGVVKSSGAFYQLLLASPDVQFQPGSYELKKHMSAKSALAALKDSANKVTATVVVPEGAVLADVEASLVAKGGLKEADVQAAAKNVSAYGLPSGVTSLEGWVFPATYTVNPGWTAEQYFALMTKTMIQHLDAAGVPEADRQHVVVFASLVQKEAGLAADYPKVARVFQNRLDQGMDLQSDATVAYGTGNTHRVTTTDSERADAGNKYNTYVHEGLPPGPISNPGDIAIDAVMHPAAGNWLYFVTVNLETGETAFSDTYAQHETAVKQFQAWLRAHPSYQ